MLPKGDAFDLFSGGRRTLRKEVEEKIPRKQAGLIRFSTESHPETTIFSPDGQSLVTGSVDGFIELWDCDTCKLRKDLDYQMKDELMMHEEVMDEREREREREKEKVCVREREKERGRERQKCMRLGRRRLKYS